jgi:fumarate hydratase class I
MSCQFSLPDEALGAGRDLAGVRACLLQAAWQAQVSAARRAFWALHRRGPRGGLSRGQAAAAAPADRQSPVPALAELEQRVWRRRTSSGSARWAWGGGTTLLGVKIAARPRLPALTL